MYFLIIEKKQSQVSWNTDWNITLKGRQNTKLWYTSADTLTGRKL